jgi:autotransporter-associated beta strand protein
MNRIYRLVWNRAKRVMQVASELAGSGAHGGGTTRAGARYRPRHALALACALALPGASAWAATPTVDTTQPFYDQFSAALLQNPVVFEGGIFKPTTGFTLSTPITLDTPGGFVDATNGNVYLSGAVSGPGGLNITAGGVALTTANTYSGGTTINNGAVLGIQLTLAALPGNVVDNGYLQLEATTGTYTGTISGLGGVQVVSLGGGALVLTGNHTAAGTLFIYDSTVQLGAGGTTGSWGGSGIAVASSLVFDRSDTLTYGGLISDFNGGHGSLTQAGTGTLILAGNNTYTGGTTISAGTLQIGNGGATGAITGNVVDNGTLVLDRSGTLTVSGVISGTG